MEQNPRKKSLWHSAGTGRLCYTHHLGHLVPIDCCCCDPQLKYLDPTIYVLLSWNQTLAIWKVERLWLNGKCAVLFEVPNSVYSMDLIAFGSASPPWPPSNWRPEDQRKLTCSIFQSNCCFLFVPESLFLLLLFFAILSTVSPTKYLLHLRLCRVSSANNLWAWVKGSIYWCIIFFAI